MKFKLHNKIEIKIRNKTYTFFNNLTSKILDALADKMDYSSYLAVGDGNPINQQNNKLSHYLYTFSLNDELIQSDISKGSPYIKKSISLSDFYNLNGKYITEVGLAYNNETNPDIVNYISLISDETPNGVFVKRNEQIILYLYIYLNIETNNNFVITSGENPFIEFLLGKGVKDKIYASRGNCLIENTTINREESEFPNKIECDFNYTKNSNGIEFTFSADLGVGNLYEMVFLIGNKPFARIQTLEYQNTTNNQKTITPKECYMLDLGHNVKNINSVTNSTTEALEENYYFKNYATSFGDKITLPFNGLFDNETPRFVSKDGDKIFFLLNDKVYGYKNENYKLIKLNTDIIKSENIYNIVSFENYLFVFNKDGVGVRCYFIANNNLTEIKINLNENFSETFNNAMFADVACGKNNRFMLAVIDGINNNGITFFYNHDLETNSLVFVNSIQSNYKFSYLLAMHRNNFSDAKIIYLKEGVYSNECRIVYHLPDQTEEDVYSSLAYLYTKNTKEIYVKSRGIVVEKTTDPKILLYYYPQMYEYKLPLISDEDNDYISTNLLYLIQKKDVNYKIYNLVGYNEPVEFQNGFPEFVNTNLILDFEFLYDTLLIFMNNPNEPIIALNLNQICGAIENISSIESSYFVSYEKYNIIGEDGKGVIANFVANISI